MKALLTVASLAGSSLLGIGIAAAIGAKSPPAPVAGPPIRMVAASAPPNLTFALGQEADEAVEAPEAPPKIVAQAKVEPINAGAPDKALALADKEPTVPASMLLEAIEKLTSGQRIQPETQVEQAEPPPAAKEAPKAESPRERESLPAPDINIRRRKDKPKRTNEEDDAEGDNQLSIHIKDTDLRDVLELLAEQGGLNILASESVGGTVSASLNNVDVDTALEAILRSTGYIARREGSFIYVGTPQDFANLRTALDRIGTRVYRPNYVTAAELQSLLTPLLSATGKISVTTPAERGIAADSNNVGGDAFANAEALVIQDYEAVLAEIDQVVKEVDRRPLQVAIEAMILSVKLDDEHRFGVDFQFLRDKNNIRFGTGSPVQAPLGGGGQVDPTTGAMVGEFSLSGGGLKFAFLDESLGTFVAALESIGDTNVIATPRVMCLNKQRAEILIGAQLGYVSTTLTETSTSQNVEFLEVGAQLRIRPFISNDGLIRMEIHPELSTGSVRVENGFTLPDKELTQVTTNIMAHDGCTVVLGGLMREDLTTTTTQVPYIGSLPGVGFLFRNKTESIERREILVLVTPRIVKDAQAAAEGIEGAYNFHRRQEAYADQMALTGRRHVARRYLARARMAMENGNLRAARRAIQYAWRFDPSNQEIVLLRDELLGLAPGPAGVVIDRDYELPLEDEIVLEGPVEPWMLEDLTRTAPLMAPMSEGQGGYRVDVVRPETELLNGGGGRASE